MIDAGQAYKAPCGLRRPSPSVHVRIGHPIAIHAGGRLRGDQTSEPTEPFSARQRL